MQGKNMHLSTQNPVTVTGTGTDSENQVRPTTILVHTVDCADTYYSDYTETYHEVQDLAMDLLPVIESLIPVLNDSREAHRRKVMIDLICNGGLSSDGYESFELRNGVWIGDRLFCDITDRV